MSWTITRIWSVYLLKILFFCYFWLASRNKFGYVGEIWFNYATELSGCSLCSYGDHPWNFNTTGRKCVPVTTHLRGGTSGFPPCFVLEGVMCCQRGESAGIVPLRPLFVWKLRGACPSLSTLEEPNLLPWSVVNTRRATGTQGGRWWGEMSSQCWAVPAASLPVAPPLLVLPCIIFQQSGLSYKKVENKENYFFLIIELCFPDGLVLLESCFNTAFSISIDSSNKIKLY